MVFVSSWTESGDTNPQFGNCDATQYGMTSGTSSTPSHGQFTEVWVRDSSLTRHGTYSIRTTCFRNSYGISSTNANLNIRVYPEPFGPGGLGISDGKEEWCGWSWYFPSNFPQGGSDIWSIMGQYIPSQRSLFPTYHTIAWRPTVSSLKLSFKTGKLPSPGATGFNPIVPPNGNGYDVERDILGPTIPNHPFTKGVWHDFYCYILWKAQSPGIFDIWHRVEGGTFSKVYSNRNDGSAAINVAPHATLLWNQTNGIPTNGGRSIYMCYRPAAGAGLSNDVQYWADGFFTRQTQAEILAEFSGAGEAEPPPDPAAGHSRIGTTTPGTSLSSIVVDAKRVMRRDTIPSGSTVDIHKFYARLAGSASGAQVMKAVVYDHAGSSPTALMGSSDAVTIAQSAAEDWVLFSCSTPIRATGPLSFGLHSGGTVAAQASIHTATSGLWSNTDSYAGVSGDPAGASAQFGTATLGNIELAMCADFTVAVDTTAPTVSSATIQDDLVQITFSEDIDPASIPDESAFVVRVTSVARTMNDDLAISGTSLSFTLDGVVNPGEAVEFDYTSPTTGKLRDLAPSPNNVANITAETVTNITQAQPPPVLTRIQGIARISGTRLSGTRISGTRIS